MNKDMHIKSVFLTCFPVNCGKILKTGSIYVRRNFWVSIQVMLWQILFCAVNKSYK